MSSKQWKTTSRTPGRNRARSSSQASGTPLHLPITLHPSTQSWRVICVRVGIARKASSENSSGRSTSPAICNRYPANPPAFIARYSGVCGLVEPLGRNTGEIIDSGNSAARRWPVSARWMRWLSGSATLSTSTKRPLLDNAPQPVSNAAPVPAIAARSKRRRAIWMSSVIVRSHISEVFPHAETPGDHRSHFVDRACVNDHDHVYERKQHEQRHDDEMQAARSLASTDELQPAAEHRIHLRRHRQSRQDRQWHQHEDHAQIGELLQRVVARGFLTLRMPEAQVVDDRLRNLGPVTGLQRQVALYVSNGPAPPEIDCAVDHPQPCEKEVPAAAQRQRARPGNRRPFGEPTLDAHAVGAFRHAKHPRRVEFSLADRSDAARLAVWPANGIDGEIRVIEPGCDTPVQRGMRVEDLQAAANQHDHAQQVDPVHDPQWQAVAQHDAPFATSPDMCAWNTQLHRGRRHRPPPVPTAGYARRDRIQASSATTSP